MVNIDLAKIRKEVEALKAKKVVVRRGNISNAVAAYRSYLREHCPDEVNSCWFMKATYQFCLDDGGGKVIQAEIKPLANQLWRWIDEGKRKAAFLKMLERKKA